MIFNFSNYDLLLPLATNSLIVGALLAIVGGLVGVFVIGRDQSFAVHGISELSFAGASVTLLLGGNVVFGSVIGSLIAALVIGLLGARAKERNSITAVLMPFGLGLGILALSLYQGRASNKFGLLTGQIVAVDDPQLVSISIISALVIAILLIVWRPLSFASFDSEVAAAKRVPVKTLSVIFMLLLGLAVAEAVQVVGALLVLSILVTPAASAVRLSRAPMVIATLSVVFALVSVVLGILLALGSSLPISPYVTSISFLIYLVARGVEWLRNR